MQFYNWGSKEADTEVDTTVIKKQQHKTHQNPKTHKEKKKKNWGEAESIRNHDRIFCLQFQPPPSGKASLAAGLAVSEA